MMQNNSSLRFNFLTSVWKIKNFLIRVMIATLLTACGPRDSEIDPGQFISPIGEVPAEPQRPGDPQAGYDALLNKPYISCGVPYKAYKKAVSPSSAAHRLPDRSGHNAELPYHRTYYKKSNGVELVTGNCLTCHAGFFNGELIIGLGNENLDFTGDASASAETIGAYVRGDSETAEWQKWADRMAAVAPYIRTETVGVNPAIDITWALIAHRNRKTLEWSSEPLMEPPPKYVLPLSMPPWWRMKKKHAMFYTTAGRGDHARHMILGTVLCAESVVEVKGIDTYAPDIRAYISSLESPVYPFEIDINLAEQGRAPFNTHCARCHGTYGDNWTYPNLVISKDVVGTDPALAQASTDATDRRFVQWFGESFYGELSRLAPAPGYIAPPLDGIWATAPYLHNGSVPTIAALLNISLRPKYWTRAFDSRDYNDKTLGWTYSVLKKGKDGAQNHQEAKKIYDTTLYGYSNRGHDFGDRLTEVERLKVLEYLKTL